MTTSTLSPIPKPTEGFKQSIPDGYYYLKTSHKIQGPFHYQQILTFIREGQTKAHYTFSSDQNNWQNLNYFPHFEIEEESKATETAFEADDLPQGMELDQKKLEACFLKHEDKIQGPFHFQHILRYVKENRLPKEVEFSQNQQEWVSLNSFFQTETYYLKTQKKIQGPFHFAKILRYSREGRLSKTVQFSANITNWQPFNEFPYL